MTVFHLTLVSHGLTRPQRTGRFHQEEDDLLDPAQVRPVADLTQSCLSAPERRALQTTERLGLLGEVDNALRDCDLGQWAGKSLKTLQRESPAELAAWLSDAEAAPHGGESIARLCQRMGDWLDGFDRPGRWVAVTHPMVIRAVMLHVLGAPPMAFHSIDVQPLARIRLSHYGRWRLQLTEPYPGQPPLPGLSS